jgi:signal transduction histidine kinase
LTESLQLIEQAKQEWEVTADSLPQFVCLLDEQGRIRRANRTVERWGLGPVTEVRGLRLHDLFHPDCGDPACYLAVFWRQAWEKLTHGQADECEAEDTILKRHFNLQIYPLTPQTAATTAASNFGVMVVEDITQRKRAEAALQQAYSELEQRVTERTAELANAVSALKKEVAERTQTEIKNVRLIKQVQQGREQMRQLAQQTVVAQEEERQRLSRELHDEAGQALTALKMTLETIQLDLPAEVLRQQLNRAAKLADTTMEELRTLARDLRPPALDTVGLNPALEGLCRDFAGWVHLPVDYQGVIVEDLPNSADISLYRCLQEALTNVAKHAQAEQVWVRLQADDRLVTLSVEDDGCGFDLAAGSGSPQMSNGIGLLGIRERLELLGGRLEFETRPGRGTRLTAYLPREAH